ncbi:MAG: patatin-like phospholipase family protein [Chloroflexi bacterium]|nr:patatin-like phospholipase family protein [Chloroflexota bacterium]
MRNLFRRRSAARSQVGLALSGGAVRGFAHLGVWEVLHEQGFEPCCVVGTSAGSIMGALIAAGVPPQAIWEQAETLNWRKLLRPVSPARLGWATLAPLVDLLEELMGGPKTFADLPIPFACVAFDLEREEPILLREGRVALAVQASCSVPGLFAPVEWEGRLLVDGGVARNLPTCALHELGATRTIAVDVIPKRGTPARPRTPIGVGLNALYNLVRANHELHCADVVITPNVRDISFNDIGKRHVLAQRGREAAQHAWPDIQTLLT